jgi:uncharacterized protein YdaU (DUF1376 family)
MPVFIGDYLADTMHLNTEQHGAYLLLLFHLWRRGVLHDNDAALAQITGLTLDAWSNARAVLADFFEIHDGLWQHGRVERERSRIAAKQHSNSSRASSAASKRWKTPSLHAPSNARALLGDADSESESESYTESESEAESEAQVTEASVFFLRNSVKRAADRRHTEFRSILAEYWAAKNHAAPEMPWQGRDAKALSDFLAASPNLTSAQFREMLGNRAKSAVAHGDRVYLWIANLTRFQEEITVYNKPASAGGGYASRAEINRNSVVSAVDRALLLAREHTDRTGQAGVEPAAFDDAGVSAADGPGPGGDPLALSGNGDHGMAAGDAADGQAGTDGPLSYRAPTAAPGRAYAAGGSRERGPQLRFDREVTAP